MGWSFQGSWTILISGTAVGLSLVGWSLRRVWRQRRREVCIDRRAVLLEQYRGEQHAVGELPEVVTATMDLRVDDSGQPPAVLLAESCMVEGTEPEACPAHAPTAHAPTMAEEPPEGGTTCEDEVTLFALGAGMYELKAAAEELPIVQVRRRAVRRQVAEQLLLWPDADEPLHGVEASAAAGAQPAESLARLHEGYGQ